MVWAVPVSLAATQGIARTFFLTAMASNTIFNFDWFVNFEMGPRTAPSLVNSLGKRYGNASTEPLVLVALASIRRLPRGIRY